MACEVRNPSQGGCGSGLERLEESSRRLASGGMTPDGPRSVSSGEEAESRPLSRCSSGAALCHKSSDRQGIKSLSDGVIPYVARREFRQRWQSEQPSKAASLPAVIHQNEDEDEHEEEGRRHSSHRLRLSQAQLIIPESVSQYLELCRFSRSHSEGLIFARHREEEGCRELVRRRLQSDSVLLRRRYWQIMQEASDGAAPLTGPGGVKARPERKLELEQLLAGSLHEGQIVKLRKHGVLVDIGAVVHGFLRWKILRGVPRTLIKTGEAFSNLEVQHIDLRRRRFELVLVPIGHDGEELKEVGYQEILERIAAWASVVLPGSMSRSSKTSRGSKGKSGGKAGADVVDAVKTGKGKRKRRARTGASNAAEAPSLHNKQCALPANCDPWASEDWQTKGTPVSANSRSWNSWEWSDCQNRDWHKDSWAGSHSWQWTESWPAGKRYGQFRLVHAHGDTWESTEWDPSGWRSDAWSRRKGHN
eukprot:TRINITY_DN17376_c0_g1_i1.p1 TRINITY_DN17376_c0_g1~~TRINITY_DN17376_c0_g1_i1.p1  ORF type:complete len:476 (+),score=77.96 TRINITY_DN17376_c0_g1_i1:51-1478(+)